MEKYCFIEYRGRYKVDPVFKTTDYILFGNPGGIDSPDLFEVYIKNRRFRYCLINPKQMRNNESFLVKLRRYLKVHEENDNLDNQINTYFIGEMEKSIDVSDGFTDQNIFYVTNEMIEQWYPKKLSDIFKIIIEHVIKRQKYLGEHNFFLEIDDDITFADENLSDLEKRDYKLYLRKCMSEEGLISFFNDGMHIDGFDLTSKAIDSVQNKKTENNKVAFIAIKFDKNETRINAIQDAIAKAGFEPRIMSQLETNNWIMPEIFYQIQNCRFVVADFSLPCDGAYYEAGYAAALNKPVIHLFDKNEESENNKLHFDIAQKSTIFYENFDDLKDRLFNRIKSTIK